MKLLLEYIKKEFYQIFRDRATLLLLIAFPIVLIILFGFALTNEIKHAKIAVCNYADDETSQEIINKLSANRTFEVEKLIYSHAKIYDAFKEGDIKLVVIFPNNFSNDLYHLHTAGIQIIADASDPNLATILTSYVNAVIIDYQSTLRQNNIKSGLIVPVVRMLYNPDLKGAPEFVPGIMSLVLMIICVLMTSISIVKEKETGTMEILLMAPISPLLILIAKAVPYFVISLVNLALIILLSVYVLDVPIKGSLLLLFAESSLLVITALSLGLYVSSITATQQTAILTALLGMLVPTMLFTGFFFPIDDMPIPLQLISNLVPARWYYLIVKAVMIKGVGLSVVWKETLTLAGMTVFFLILSVRMFKSRLE